MKILVVDDEKGVKRLFERRFRRECHNGQVDFHFAFSGEEALTFLQEGGNSDLEMVFSDINMPRMSGLELLKIIKENYPALNVFMITAYADEKNRKAAIEMGAEDYFTKPINFNDLKERILK